MTDSPGVSRARPVHLRWRSVALVGSGGAVGTAARQGLALAVPVGGGLPVIMGINIVGAFLLGMLLESLVRPGRGERGRVTLGLLLGTGFLGGFTTYSALATDTALLTGDGQFGAALLYSFATLALGGVASWAGIVVGGRLPVEGQRR